MLLRRPGLLLGLLAPAIVAATPACGEGGPVSGDFAPFRSAWEEVGTFAFPYLDEEGLVQISSVLVGGTEYNDNFANRGDVIVKMTGPDNLITVEMRKFGFADSQEAALLDFDRLKPWIWSANPTSPNQPDAQSDQTKNCIGDAGWQDGCGIRVWYDGQNQPVRLGADIRVTLPASYRQRVTIVTQDNVQEDAYQARGDVCVENANGNVEIDLRSGEAFIIASPDLTPGPTCTAEQITACEEYMDDGVPAAWHPECACTTFGSFVVESKDAGSANVTVDIPETLWASMNLDNKSQSNECTATIDFAGAVIDPVTANLVYQERGEINHPSDAAIAGAGFGVRLSSDECSKVLYSDEPSDYPGAENEDEQKSEQRGNLRVCAGPSCLTGQTCASLLPGT